MDFTELGKAPFIALETFRHNGVGVITPVWVAGENEKLYVWTNLDSWKVKRIRNNSRVRICESDTRGNPKSDWLEAKSQVLDSEKAREKAIRLFKAKYGLQFRMFTLLGRNNPRAIVEIESL